MYHLQMIPVTDINRLNFEINLKQTFKDINTWFTSNISGLNFDKTQYTEFRPMNYYVPVWRRVRILPP
jgi:hypothetical protein